MTTVQSFDIYVWENKPRINSRCMETIDVTITVFVLKVAAESF